MKGEVIAEDGMGVKYDELKHSKLFAQYKDQAAQLDSVDLAKLSENEKSAFFISILSITTWNLGVFPFTVHSTCCRGQLELIEFAFINY